MSVSCERWSLRPGSDGGRESHENMKYNINLAHSQKFDYEFALLSLSASSNCSPEQKYVPILASWVEGLRIYISSILTTSTGRSSARCDVRCKQKVLPVLGITLKCHRSLFVASAVSKSYQQHCSLCHFAVY